MNYLAHAFLSGNIEHLMVGNFIADHIRGNQLAIYSPGIIEGIRLHRRIDAFTDSHPLFRESKRIFYGGFEKHSGILLDIYFDHLLASGFNKFSSDSLRNFADNAYKTYEGHRDMLPEGSLRFLGYLIKNDIYTSYASPEGIEKVLYNLSQRIRHGVRLDQSISVFLKNEEQLRQTFEEFFRQACSAFLPEPG